MKKIFYYFPLVLIFISCTNNTPEKRIKAFYEAISNNDSKKAQSLATEETADYIKEQLGKNYQVTVLSCEPQENKTTCSCVFNEEVEPKDIRLVKVNGEWLVDKEASALRQLINSIKNIDIKGTVEELEFEIKDGLDAIKELVDDSSKLQKAGNDLEKLSNKMEKAIEEMKEKEISSQE